jgi:hypothetical protein
MFVTAEQKVLQSVAMQLMRSPAGGANWRERSIRWSSSGMW